MFPYVFLLFITMPILEIFLLIQLGGVLGVWTTLLIVILTAVLGTMMLRQQSLATLQSVRSRLDSGELPATQMLEGVALLIGGVLLLTPGFITDTIGFVCLLPVTRRWMVKRLVANANIAVFSQHARTDGFRSDAPGESMNRGQKPQDRPDIIEGEYRRED